MQQPSVLVYIDGEPQFVPIEGTKLVRVVNTRVLLLKDSTGKRSICTCWTATWRRAALAGPWSVAK